MPKRRGIMDYTPTAVTVLEEVNLERLRQDAKWGKQDHTQMVWLGILAEEFGEAAKEVNELHFRPCPKKNCDGDCLEGSKERVRTELIQTAAVAVAMVESLDRNGR